MLRLFVILIALSGACMAQEFPIAEVVQLQSVWEQVQERACQYSAKFDSDKKLNYATFEKELDDRIDQKARDGNLSLDAARTALAVDWAADNCKKLSDPKKCSDQDIRIYCHVVTYITKRQIVWSKWRDYQDKLSLWVPVLDSKLGGKNANSN